MFDKSKSQTGEDESRNSVFFPPKVSSNPIQNPVQRYPGTNNTIGQGNTPSFSGSFVTPDSAGPLTASNLNGSTLTFNLHVDYLTPHTNLNIFIANQRGGDYKAGAPLHFSNSGPNGGPIDETVTLSPVKEGTYVRFEARSEKTFVTVPRITGTYN
ncbi:MAG TPA: hypothetical protein VK809_12945 [Bacteroidia bacterium]|nr:hypothetical protein [Bacteroidia bacterium]